MLGNGASMTSLPAPVNQRLVHSEGMKAVTAPVRLPAWEPEIVFERVEIVSEIFGIVLEIDAVSPIDAVLSDLVTTEPIIARISEVWVSATLRSRLPIRIGGVRIGSGTTGDN